MNIIEGILDSLADGGESIIQISEYLTYLGINVEGNVLIATILELIDAEKIIVEYPKEERGRKSIDITQIEDYWFELTSEGRKDWNNIEENSESK